jgi:large subunit ribosomal protein L24
MKKFKIRKGDTVIVTAGKHKKTVGRVTTVLTERDAVHVEGVTVKRHVKSTGDRPGGIMKKNTPVHISNVALWDKENQRAMRVGWKLNDAGQKVRFDRKSGNIIDQ